MRHPRRRRKKISALTSLRRSRGSHRIQIFLKALRVSNNFAAFCSQIRNSFMEAHPWTIVSEISCLGVMAMLKQAKELISTTRKVANGCSRAAAKLVGNENVMPSLSQGTGNSSYLASPVTFVTNWYFRKLPANTMPPSWPSCRSHKLNSAKMTVATPQHTVGPASPGHKHPKISIASAKKK